MTAAEKKQKKKEEKERKAKEAKEKKQREAQGGQGQPKKGPKKPKSETNTNTALPAFDMKDVSEEWGHPRPFTGVIFLPKWVSLNAPTLGA